MLVNEPLECLFPFVTLDIDECSLNGHDCHANATCSDIDGSYTCSCNVGYSGNGTFCTGKLNLIHVWLVGAFVSLR